MNQFLKILLYLLAGVAVIGAGVWIFYPSLLERLAAYMLEQVLCGAWLWGCE